MSRTAHSATVICTALAIAACASPPLSRKAAIPPVAASSCADFSFPIYFDKGSDQLTASARAVLLAGAQSLKACKVARIEVLGLADADGPAHRNLVLSRQRATTVAHALEGTGLPTPVFDIEAIGEAGARAGGRAEPLRRRTEVIVHIAP